MSTLTREEMTSLVTRILELREEGYTYREIDTELELPEVGGGHSTSWRIMNSEKARFVKELVS